MKTAERPGGALALVGLWADIHDIAIEAFVADIAVSRRRDRGRRVSPQA